jgi:hypothetical protein
VTDESVKLTAFPVANGLAGTDSVVALYFNGSTTNSSIITATNLFGNSKASYVVQNGYSLIVANTFTPANSTANGIQGTIAWDSSFIYVCTANNVWKRATLASF